MTNYYINHREIKDEDFVNVNPNVQEEYDENGEIKINLVQHTWKDIDTLPAFYLFQFSNGYSYAGSTKNMLMRLTQHYYDFCNFAKTDWHKKVGDIIRERTAQSGKTKNFKYHFCAVVKIFIQYTSSKEAAELLEKRWLREVKKQGQDSLYYNGVFYSGQGSTSIKKNSDLELNKIVNEAAQLFKGKQIVNISQPKTYPLTERDKILYNQIEEKVNKMAKTGAVNIRIPHLYFDEIYASDDAHTFVKYVYQQLTFESIKEPEMEKLKSLKMRNGGPLKIEDIKVFIDGDTTYYWTIRNQNTIKYIIDDIPQTSGVYFLKFPNGKEYIGSSNNLKRRIKEHLREIYVRVPRMLLPEFKESGKSEWYWRCVQDLVNNHSIYGVKIDYIECSDYRIREQEEIKKKPISQLYNTQKRV